MWQQNDALMGYHNALRQAGASGYGNVPFGNPSHYASTPVTPAFPAAYPYRNARRSTAMRPRPKSPYAPQNHPLIRPPVQQSQPRMIDPRMFPYLQKLM